MDLQSDGPTRADPGKRLTFPGGRTASVGRPIGFHVDLRRTLLAGRALGGDACGRQRELPWLVGTTFDRSQAS